jgi:hypothetical protein
VIPAIYEQHGEAGYLYAIQQTIRSAYILAHCYSARWGINLEMGKPHPSGFGVVDSIVSGTKPERLNNLYIVG